MAQAAQAVIGEALQHAAVAALGGLLVSVVAVGVGEALPVDRLHQLRHLIVAVVGPAELVLVPVCVRLPDPDQAIRGVVVVPLRVHKRPARDLVVHHGGAVLLHPGQRALAVVKVTELHAGPVLHGPPGGQIIELAVAVCPAVSVVFVGVIVRAAVHLPRQGPGPRVVAVLHQGIGAAYLNSRQQLRRAVCQRVVRGSIGRVGVAQARQQFVAVGVGDGAAARLAAHRTAPTVIGIARHGARRIGDAHHQGELRVVGVAHRLTVVARDRGGHVPVRGVGRGAGQTLFSAAGDRRPCGVAVAIVAVAARYPRVADGVVQQAAVGIGIAVLRPAGQGDGGDVRGVSPVGVGGFPPLQVRDLVHTAFVVIVVDVSKLLPEQLCSVKVALICIIIVKEGKFNGIIRAAGPYAAGKELPFRAERVGLQQLAVHLRAAVQQPHPDAAVSFQGAVGGVLVAQRDAAGLHPGAEGVIVPQAAADGEGLGVALGLIVPALQLQDRIVQLELGRGAVVRIGGDAVPGPQAGPGPVGGAVHVRVLQQIVAAGRLRLLQLQLIGAAAAGDRQAIQPVGDGDGDLRPLRAADRGGALADSPRAHAQSVARCRDAGEAVRLTALDADGPGPVRAAFRPLLQQVHHRVLQTGAVGHLVGPAAAAVVRGKGPVQGLPLLVIHGNRVAQAVEFIGAPAAHVVRYSADVVAVQHVHAVDQGLSVIVSEFGDAGGAALVGEGKLVAAAVAALDIHCLRQAVVEIGVVNGRSVGIIHAPHGIVPESVVDFLDGRRTGSHVGHRDAHRVGVAKFVDASGPIRDPRDAEIFAFAVPVFNAEGVGQLVCHRDQTPEPVKAQLVAVPVRDRVAIAADTQRIAQAVFIGPLALLIVIGKVDPGPVAVDPLVIIYAGQSYQLEILGIAAAPAPAVADVCVAVVLVVGKGDVGGHPAAGIAHVTAAQHQVPREVVDRRRPGPPRTGAGIVPIALQTRGVAVVDEQHGPAGGSVAVRGVEDRLMLFCSVLRRGDVRGAAVVPALHRAGHVPVPVFFVGSVHHFRAHKLEIQHLLLVPRLIHPFYALGVPVVRDGVGLHKDRFGIIPVRIAQQALYRVDNHVSALQLGELPVFDKRAPPRVRIALSAHQEIAVQTVIEVTRKLIHVGIQNVVGVNVVRDGGIQHHWPHAFFALQPLPLRRIAQEVAALAQLLQLHGDLALALIRAVHQEGSLENKCGLVLCKKADLAVLRHFSAQALRPDLVGELFRDKACLGEGDRFLQRLPVHLVSQLCPGQRFRVTDRAGVMHKNGLRERIVPGSVFFLHKGFARLRPRKAKIQLMPAVRNPKPALLVQSHRQHHAEAVLPVVIQHLVLIPQRLLRLARGESRLLRKELFRLHRFQPVVDLGPAPALLKMNRLGIGGGEHTAVRHTELLDVCFSFAVVFSHRNGVCRLLHFLFPRFSRVIGPGTHILRRHQLQQHDQNQQQRKQGFSDFSHVCLLSASQFPRACPK